GAAPRRGDRQSRRRRRARHRGRAAGAEECGHDRSGHAPRSPEGHRRPARGARHAGRRGPGVFGDRLVSARTFRIHAVVCDNALPYFQYLVQNARALASKDAEISVVAHCTDTAALAAVKADSLADVVVELAQAPAVGRRWWPPLEALRRRGVLRHRTLRRRVSRPSSLLLRGCARCEPATPRRVARNIGRGPSPSRVTVLNRFGRRTRKTTKRTSTHSGMLRTKETRHRMFIGL